jgi:hypothetical protein
MRLKATTSTSSRVKLSLLIVKLRSTGSRKKEKARVVFLSKALGRGPNMYRRENI